MSIPDIEEILNYLSSKFKKIFCDREFVCSVNEDFQKFILKNNHNQRNVLVFPVLGPIYLKAIFHQAKIFGLTAFSIGCGNCKSVAVCLKDSILKHQTTVKMPLPILPSLSSTTMTTTATTVVVAAAAAATTTTTTITTTTTTTTTSSPVISARHKRPERQLYIPPAQRKKLKLRSKNNNNNIVVNNNDIKNNNNDKIATIQNGKFIKKLQDILDIFYNFNIFPYQTIYDKLYLYNYNRLFKSDQRFNLLHNNCPFNNYLLFNNFHNSIKNDDYQSNCDKIYFLNWYIQIYQLNNNYYKINGINSDYYKQLIIKNFGENENNTKYCVNKNVINYDFINESVKNSMLFPCDDDQIIEYIGEFNINNTSKSILVNKDDNIIMLPDKQFNVDYFNNYYILDTAYNNSNNDYNKIDESYKKPYCDINCDTNNLIDLSEYNLGHFFLIKNKNMKTNQININNKDDEYIFECNEKHDIKSCFNSFVERLDRDETKKYNNISSKECQIKTITLLNNMNDKKFNHQNEHEQEKEIMRKAKENINRKTKPIMKYVDDVNDNDLIDKNNSVNNWEELFDDNGHIQDDLFTEIVQKVGNDVNIVKANEDYSAYSNKSMEELEHVVELYNFPASLGTHDLVHAFRAVNSDAMYIKWVDDTHALLVLGSSVQAKKAISMSNSLIKVRPMTSASAISMDVANKSDLKPAMKRPPTNLQTARRLITTHLGAKVKTDREKLAKERMDLKKAKEMKQLIKQSEIDAWEGKL